MSVKMLATDLDARKGVTMKSDPARIDPLKLKLGKQPPRHDPRTLLFATYATATLPAPPPSLNLTTKVKVPWGMMDNAQIGDCTCAAAGHLMMEWTANAQSKIFTPSDAQIIAAYSAITGYNPKTGANDNGAQEVDVLNYWRQTGIAGHKIQAFMALEPHPHHGWNLDLRRLLHRTCLAQECPSPDQQQPDLVRASLGYRRRRRARLLGRTRRTRGRLRFPQPHRCNLGRAANHDMGLLGRLLR
jgi:hypothetical protein